MIDRSGGVMIETVMRSSRTSWSIAVALLGATLTACGSGSGKDAGAGDGGQDMNQDGDASEMPGEDGGNDAEVQGDATDAAQPLPHGVLAIAGGPAGALAGVLVDSQNRLWVAHPTGVAVQEAGSWRDTSGGLTSAIADFHETPAGELFASGPLGGWRLENGTWVRRLNAPACNSPLRLASLGDLLFGVCYYYAYYAAWPSRDPAAVTVKMFTPGAVGAVAVLDAGDIFAVPGPDYQEQRLLHLPAGADYQTATNWTAVPLPAEVGTRAFNDVWAVATGSAVVVGAQGLAVRLQAGTWTVEDTGISDDLVAVWGTEADGTYAVGAAGRIVFRGSDGVWQPVSSGTTARLVGIHGRTGGRVVVVGANATLLEIVR